MPERRTVATKDVTIFLERAGLSEERVNKMLDMYGASKQMYSPQLDVDFLIEEGR